MKVTLRLVFFLVIFSAIVSLNEVRGRCCNMVTVITTSGKIRGIYKDGIAQFLGIPYAYPPTHHHRFKHSELSTSWENDIEATHFKSIPPQPYNKLETFFSSENVTFPQSEDCLYLNIWMQNNKHTHKPVIIYFYGGGFVNGHGSAELYTPESIVQQHDVIVITFNYRLGALGFLDWSYFNKELDKNNGLSDQINVLKWVQNYIESFGGDPQNITLMGQSAGSMSIMALMQTPKLDSLYHRVILLSGTLRLDKEETGYLKAQHFHKLIDTHFPNKELEDLTVSDILELQALDEASRGKSKGLELIYTPIEDDSMTRPLSQFTKPIVVGVTNDEGDCYIRNESRKLDPSRFVDVMALNDISVEESASQTGKQQAQLVTDLYFKAPALHLLDTLPHAKCWYLRFDWHLPNSSDFNSAYHILDLVFWFGKMNILKAHDIKNLTSETKLSEQMISDLVTFATSDTMPWQPYHSNNKNPHIYN